MITGVVRRLSYNDPTMEQKDAVTAFVSGRDVFISLPTNGGTSLCYACLFLTYRATSLHMPLLLVHNMLTQH